MLAWMSAQDFAAIASGEPSLLSQVEAVVLAAHRDLYARSGRRWSRPLAYRWLRYEDPMPLARLSEGVDKLDRLGARFDPLAVDKACAEAVRRGFSN
jgi:hypothetical protein